MNKKVLAVLLLSAALLLTALGNTGVAQKKKVVIDLKVIREGQYRVKDPDYKDWALFNEFVDSLKSWGYDVVVAYGGINSSILKDADALVVGKLELPECKFDQSEIDAIKNWFSQGGKFLWIGADSDYLEPELREGGTAAFKALEPNRILEAIGSSIRINPTSVEDTKDNAGAAYRVVSRTKNTQGEAGQITSGVTQVLFHGPTCVVGFKNGKPVDFSEVESETCFWLFKTSENGRIADHDDTDPFVYDRGEKGSFVLAAAEKIKVGGAYSKVIVTGESIIGDRNIFTKGPYHNLTYDGPTFVKNAFAWGTTVEKAGLPIQVIAAVIVVIVVIAAVAAFLMMKKKKKE